MQVIVTPKALKQYNHLSKAEQAKVKRRLVGLEKSPFEGKKLSGEYSNLRSLKAWPYRVIYFVDEKQKKVFVVAIVHRQSAY